VLHRATSSSRGSTTAGATTVNVQWAASKRGRGTAGQRSEGARILRISSETCYDGEDDDGPRRQTINTSRERTTAGILRGEKKPDRAVVSNGFARGKGGMSVMKAAPPTAMIEYQFARRAS